MEDLEHRSIGAALILGSMREHGTRLGFRV